MTPTEEVKRSIDVATELRRIITSGVLAVLLLSIAVLLDGPVSILAWMLLAVAFLCLAYVVIASRQLLTDVRSQDNKAQPHE